MTLKEEAQAKKEEKTPVAGDEKVETPAPAGDNNELLLKDLNFYHEILRRVSSPSNGRIISFSGQEIQPSEHWR